MKIMTNYLVEVAKMNVTRKKTRLNDVFIFRIIKKITKQRENICKENK